MEEDSTNTQRVDISSQRMRASEQDRYGMEHAMILNFSSGKLHFAPFSPKKILDAGAGTGIWAIDGDSSMPNMT
jgi:predicted RNA methylase